MASGPRLLGRPRCRARRWADLASTSFDMIPRGSSSVAVCWFSCSRPCWTGRRRPAGGMTVQRGRGPRVRRRRRGGRATTIAARLVLVSGAACPTADAFCGYADDCGSEVLSCEDGVWVSIASGCFGDPDPVLGGSPGVRLLRRRIRRAIPTVTAATCSSAPDTPGTAYEVCSGGLLPCRRAPAGQGVRRGGAALLRHRPPCGDRRFDCWDGWWHFVGGAICTEPVACADVPVTNDACATEGEVCEPLVENSRRLPATARPGNPSDSFDSAARALPEGPGETASPCDPVILI